MMKKSSEEIIGIKASKGIGRMCLIFIAMIAIFTGLLLLVWCIPDSAVQSNYDASMETFETEGHSWNRIFTYASGSVLDNNTDRLIIRYSVLHKEDKSLFYIAMDEFGYGRYWHGYITLIRPLLTVFDYTNIRYIMMIGFMMMLCFLINGITRRINQATSTAFTLCMALAYFIIIPFSLQFAEVYMIMMITMLYLLHSYRSDWKIYRLCELFLIVGMITQYLDFLTAPLLTLGLPLCIIILINIKELANESKVKNWYTLIMSSISWAIGWSLCWVSKWAIGTIVLKENVFAKAMETAQYRVNGTADVEGKASRITAIAKNIYSMIPFSNAIGKGQVVTLLVVGIIAIALIVFLVWNYVKKQKGRQCFMCYLPLLAVGLLPIMWYIVLAQHSQVHYFYTYRIMIITWFAVFATYIGMIKGKKE